MTNKLYKHPQFGMIFCGETVTPQGNICWPRSLVVPKDAPPPQEGQPPGKPRYEATLILEKKHPAVIKFVKEIEALTDEAVILFNKGRSATINKGPIFGKYGDGDAWDLEKYNFYRGMWVLVARSAEQPKVVDNKREALQPGDIKGGMHGRFVITPLITAHGVSYKLLIVQKFEGEYTPIAGGSREVMDLLADLDEAASEETTEPVQQELPAVEAKPKKNTKAAAVNLLA